MSKNYRNRFVIFLFLIGSFNFLFSQNASVKQSPIVPNPIVCITSGEDYNLENELLINTTNLPLEIQNYLTIEFRKLYGIVLRYTTSKGQLNFKTIRNVPKDSYTINVADEITITYSSEESCFYAVNSFLQLVKQNQDSFVIPKCFVDDAPKFEWRGMHLDVSRHFFSVDEVKRYIDLMAFYKFNKFHWHLTDDQGWRIEIKQFPKLTEIGAWRDSTVIGHANSKPNQYSKGKYGGFYTQSQIKDIVKYASDRYITVIPEIEMPGHARAALAAYPEFSCTGLKHGVEGLWGIFDDIYCSKQETIDFNKKILDEVLSLFPSEYIHIGGDEAPKTRWKVCVNCQKVMKENGLTDEHALQSYFIKQIDAYLTSKGRKLMGWDEILEGGLSPNATVMSWQGESGGLEAAKQRHAVVMSPSSHCYFDHYQASSSTEPLAIGGFLTLEKVYSFDPIPKELSVQDRVYILGAQANVWTEYIPNMKQLEYMAFPRMLAMSQALWTTKKPTYVDFEKELASHQFNLLDLLKVNYSKAIMYPKIDYLRTKSGIGIVVHSIVTDEKFELEKVEKPSFNNHTITLHKQITQNDTLYFDRTRKSNFTKISTITVKAETLKKALRFEINSNSTIGFPVNLITKPNPKFNNRENLALIDGIRGSRPWKGDEWLGFDVDTIEFELDLLKSSKIKKMNIGFLMAKSSWIYLPQNVEVSVSKDNVNWFTFPKSDATEYFTQKVNKKARYIKLRIIADHKIPEGQPGEGFHPWTFIDEVEVIK